jgi:hypothetical protein
MYLKGINPIKVLFNDPLLFWSFYITSLFRTFYAKVTNKKLRLKHYAGGNVISQNEANEILKRAIKTNEKFFFGRHGSAELNIATQGLWKVRRIKKVDLNIVKQSENCGFYANKENEVLKFLELIENSSNEIDMYGTFRMVLEDYYIKRYMRKNVILTHLNMLDFWRYKIPFTSALKNKKVLVIHPLADKIESQYKKREYLFENQNVLPEFDLKTLKAVQTIMGNRDPRFDTWFEALDYMYDEAMKIDFEIAILGCGAYGMPLSARLKQAGKKVIYMGGVTQMLFGIKGDRWDRDPVASKLYNEHWIRPGDEDKPENFEKVEEGCYW